ncbi:trehalose-phosphatase [Microbacterium karelineae]|uniref:trehalose-phosphatase n=1 Tax=Microbacterium karelineae TaxID=2654283 RepID=UPI001E45DC4C|nr:trehalose-phosphatase [Microbacterium karelineae]
MTSAGGDIDVDERLDALASRERILVALDFDGTLSPLVTDPMAARATPEAARAVAALAATPGTTVALVSGRSLRDLRIIAEHDDGSPVWLAGSHGAEHWRPAGAPPRMRPVAGDDERLAARSAPITAHAHGFVQGCEGAWIEDKAFGFALHTRVSSPEVENDAQRRIDVYMAESAPEWRRRTGKHVLEFSWRHEGKDTAIAELRRASEAEAVVFAGDDVTDEDALRSLHDGDLGIRVGAGETAAHVRVDDIPALAGLLSDLAARRAR